MALPTTTFKPARRDITIYAGADFARAWQIRINGELLSLAGITADAELLLGGVRVPLNKQVDEATDTIHVWLHRSETRLLEAGTGTWDLYLIENDVAMPYLRGKVTVETTATVVESV